MCTGDVKNDTSTLELLGHLEEKPNFDRNVPSLFMDADFSLVGTNPLLSMFVLWASLWLYLQRKELNLLED